MIASVRHAASLGIPPLEPYRTLKRPLEHQQQGIFIAEGDKVVRRMLESNVRIISVLLSPQWYAQVQPLLERNQDLIDAKEPINVGDGHQMAMLIGAAMELEFIKQAVIC